VAVSRKTPPKTTSVDRTTAYAKAVTAGKIIAGPHVRAACARHLRDLQMCRARGLLFDVAAAEKAIKFFPDVLCLNGGDDEGKPFDLLPWQQFIAGSLFGWKWAATGLRRFRTAYIETGKGSGKSPLAAGIGIKMLAADDEARAEVYAAATEKDQARILFRDALAFYDQSPALQRRLTASGTGENRWNLAYLDTGSFFRIISSQNRGKSGPRPHCVLIDELHEHRDASVIRMMEAGFKKRRQPLLVAITNSGTDRTSVCYEYHEYGAKIAAGELENDTLFAFICSLDEGEDPFKDESCWIKANPSLEAGLPGLEYLRNEVMKARGMPSAEATCRRLNFCEWVEADNPVIDKDLWDACEVEGLEPLSRGAELFLALDLSAKNDLTSLAGAVAQENGEIHSAVEFWTPADTIEQREREDKVPYRAWVKAGFLNAIPGRSIDYRYPARRVGELSANFDRTTLAFDPWRIDDFQRALDEEGIDSWIYEGPDKPEGTGIRLVRHGQGFGGGDSERNLWMPRSIGNWEDAVTSAKLKVRKNPVLRWNVASAVVTEDPAGNKKFDKRKATGRIDGLIAQVMSVGAAGGVHESTDAGPQIFAL
jgi:phage terminase large subunit-like protein